MQQLCLALDREDQVPDESVNRDDASQLQHSRHPKSALWSAMFHLDVTHISPGPFTLRLLRQHSIK